MEKGWIIEGPTEVWDEPDGPVRIPTYCAGTCSNGHGWMRARGVEPPPGERERDAVWSSEIEAAEMFPTERAAIGFMREFGIADGTPRPILRARHPAPSRTFHSSQPAPVPWDNE